MKAYLAFVVDTAAYFISRRLPVAIAALERGYAVDLYTGMSASPAREQAAVDGLSRYPITHWRMKFNNGAQNSLSAGAAIWQLTRRLGSRRPDVVHAETADGLLYGGCAARLARVPAFVAGLAGSNGNAVGNGTPAGRSGGEVVGSLPLRFALGHRNGQVIVDGADGPLADAERTVALYAELRARAAGSSAARRM